MWETENMERSRERGGGRRMHPDNKIRDALNKLQKSESGSAVKTSG